MLLSFQNFKMLRIEPGGEFHDSFFKQLWEMRDNVAFTDVVLQAAGDQEIPAHRVVLTTHSPFLKNLLQGDPERSACAATRGGFGENGFDGNGYQGRLYEGRIDQSGYEGIGDQRSGYEGSDDERSVHEGTGDLRSEHGGNDAQSSGYEGSGDQTYGYEGSGAQRSGHEGSDDQRNGHEGSSDHRNDHVSSGDQRSGHEVSDYQRSGYGFWGLWGFFGFFCKFFFGSGDPKKEYESSDDERCGNIGSGDHGNGYPDSGDQRNGYEGSGDQRSGYESSGGQKSGHEGIDDRRSVYEFEGSDDQRSGYEGSGDHKNEYEGSGDLTNGHEGNGGHRSGYEGSGDQRSINDGIGNQRSGHEDSRDSRSIREKNVIQRYGSGQQRGYEICGYQRKVRLHSLDYQAMGKLIDYFYSGHLEITMADAQSMLEAVNHLELDSLLNKISEFVVENLNPENCVDWFLFADECSMQKIHNEAQMMMSQKFREVVQTNAFVKMDATQVTTYLGGEKYDHNAVLAAAFVWIGHSISKRRYLLETLLGNMQLQMCSPMMLKHIMETYGNSLITELHILKMFTSALLLHIPSHQVPALPPTSV